MVLFNIKNDGNLDIVKQWTWLQKLVCNYKRHKSYDFSPMRSLKYLNPKYLQWKSCFQRLVVEMWIYCHIMFLILHNEIDSADKW